MAARSPSSTAALSAGIARGDVTVTGPGSQLFIINGGLQVGGGGPGIGTLTVANGGTVNAQILGGPQLITVGGGGLFRGALIGDGFVTSTQINAGGFLLPGQAIVPGQGGTPAAMGVLGNLAFQSGAFYVVQVNPTTASTTNVFGPAPASLAGTVVANFAPGSYVSRSYTILTAVGGVAGTFDALRTLGLPTDFGARLSYTGNTVLLGIRAQLVPEGGQPGGR